MAAAVAVDRRIRLGRVTGAISGGASTVVAPITKVAETIAAPVVNVGADVIRRIDSYVDNTLVNDLRIIGKAINDILDKLVCSDVGIFATTLACSLSLTSAVCGATAGAAPGCITGVASQLARLAIAVSTATLALFLRCTYFHILRTIDGLCEGRAYGIAMQVANGVVADPYTIACSLSIGCACGPTSCSFSCANDPAVCYGDTWKDGGKDFFKLVEAEARRQTGGTLATGATIATGVGSVGRAVGGATAGAMGG
jgi:hypothetical protein